jgi:hypothetical protein
LLGPPVEFGLAVAAGGRAGALVQPLAMVAAPHADPAVREARDHRSLAGFDYAASGRRRDTAGFAPSAKRTNLIIRPASRILFGFFGHRDTNGLRASALNQSRRSTPVPNVGGMDKIVSEDEQTARHPLRGLRRYVFVR